jgi:hypothetical protein
MSHIEPGVNTSSPPPSVGKLEIDSDPHKDDFHMLPVGPSSPNFPADNVQWAGDSPSNEEEDQIVHTYLADVHIRRDASSAARRRSTPLWHRFFAVAHPQSVPRSVRDEDMETDDEVENLWAKKGEECITCEKGKDLICIGEAQFGYCDEGCVEPRILRAGMKCVDGKIWGAKRMDG